MRLSPKVLHTLVCIGVAIGGYAAAVFIALGGPIHG
jgi:hypothetical protein